MWVEINLQLEEDGKCLCMKLSIYLNSTMSEKKSTFIKSGWIL